MFSRSIFGNNANISRTVINPVSGLSNVSSTVSSNTTSIPNVSTGIMAVVSDTITQDVYYALSVLEKNYTSNLSKQTYQKIPMSNQIFPFIDGNINYDILRKIIVNAINTTNDRTFALLLQIALEGMDSAYYLRGVLSDVVIKSLLYVEQNYTSKLSSQNYENMPDPIDNTVYPYILQNLNNSINNGTPDSSLKLLLNIAQEGLSGSYGLRNLFSNDFFNMVQNIQGNYTTYSAQKLYERTPNPNQPENYSNYLNLIGDVSKTIYDMSNQAIQTLVKIAEDGLISSVNSYGLNSKNIFLYEKGISLQEEVETILSNKNCVHAMSNTSGSFIMNQTFKLAPLFSSYIQYWGMPAQGVGFDQYKLSLLLDIYESQGINPYG